MSPLSSAQHGIAAAALRMAPRAAAGDVMPHTADQTPAQPLQLVASGMVSYRLPALAASNPNVLPQLGSPLNCNMTDLVWM